MPRRSILLLSLAAGALAGWGQRVTSSAEPKAVAIKPGEIGSQLPEFSVKDLQGKEISSVELRGKVVLIDFWATWCQPCKKEMPGYQALLDKYGSKRFAVVGFKFDTMMDTEDPVRFGKKLRVRYPLAVASDEIKSKFGGIEGLPTTMLFDCKGVLRKKIIGFEYTNVIESELKPLFSLK